MMSRLLIVSNRLPITVSCADGEVAVTCSSGGLASGLRGPHADRDSLWIGWPGDLTGVTSAQRPLLEHRLREARVHPVSLSRRQVRDYYDGFSNGVLWPLFHHQADIVDREMSTSWKTYQEVNRLFAEAVLGCYQPGDRIWVHDYQLCLVPRMLRERLPHAEIGFFLHIPFPPAETFRILPSRVEILQGLLGADLIGFHTHSYLRHFARALTLVLGHHAREDVVQVDERRVQLGVYPMGVDARAFSREADSDAVLSQLHELRDTTPERKLLLGVDRLDYTKGVPRRLLAFDRFLENNPEWRGRVGLVQVIVPSRSTVGSYERLKREVDELVGRVNGRHATPSWVPVHNMFRSVSQTELIGLYRACDAMVVTPLRDGMNLVAKEFVASRNDGEGVLVLSEFAGAAAELSEAVTVNPYDLDGMAAALRTALELPTREQRDRMVRLRARVFGYDAYRWADTYLDELEAAGRSRFNHSDETSLETLLGAAERAERVILLLDYDGTLVPHVTQPDLARPDGELLELLAALGGTPGIEVHVVSGRSRESLEGWLGDLPIHLHAEHGFWSRWQGAVAWSALQLVGTGWKPSILEIMQRYVARAPGARVEEKTSALAWHYREVEPEVGAMQAARLRTELEAALLTEEAEVLTGSCVVEVRCRGTHKGTVMQHIHDVEATGTLAIAFGNDRTDEDLFRSLPTEGYAVHVGPGLSGASFRLPHPVAARGLLHRLLALKAGLRTPDEGSLLHPMLP